MENSKVYYTSLRARPGLNLLQKLERLIKKAGIEQIDFKDKFEFVKGERWLKCTSDCQVLLKKPQSNQS